MAALDLSSGKKTKSGWSLQADETASFQRESISPYRQEPEFRPRRDYYTDMKAIEKQWEAKSIELFESKWREKVPDMVSFINSGLDERFAHTLPVISKISEEKAEITTRNFLHSHKILERISQLERCAPSSKVVIVEQLDKETAKNRICAYMKEHKTADIEELTENLQIDLRLLVEMLDELKKEGKIVSKGI